MSDPRRDRLRARVAALSDAGRRALVDTLGRERGADEAARLVAFLVLDDASGDRSPEAPTDERLRAFLAERLPPYMVPSRFALLPRLPRTAAGKLDRRVLEREEGAELPAAARSVVAPRTHAEATLAAIWKDVLRLDDVSVHDDFFEIGGDSLLSIRVIARAGREGLRIPVDRFFDGPTIARLAAVVEEGARPAPATNSATPGGQGIVTGEAPATPIQRWFLDAISEHREHWNQSHLLAVQPSVPGDAIET